MRNTAAIIQSHLGAVLLLAFALSVSQTARAACDFTFGDEALAWVGGNVAQLSRELAAADYEARVFNFMLRGFDDLNQRIQAASNALTDVAGEMNSAERITADRLRDAILLERSSQETLTRLFEIKTLLERARSRHTDITTVPTLSQFLSDGLHHVGTTMVLGSFMQVGSEAEKTLPLKFNVYVNVSYDENGKYAGGDVQVGKVEMIDTVFVALGYEFPYVWGRLRLLQIWPGDLRRGPVQAAIRRAAEEGA